MLVYHSFFFLPSPQTLPTRHKKTTLAPAGHLRHGGLRDAGGHSVSVGTSRWWRLYWTDRAVVGIHDAWWKVSGRLGVFGAQTIHACVFEPQGFFFPSFFLNGACWLLFVFFTWGSSGPFFFSKGYVFWLSEKTPAGVVVGNLYKSTILAGSAVSSASLSLSKKTVWRVRWYNFGFGHHLQASILKNLRPQSVLSLFQGIAGGVDTRSTKSSVPTFEGC